MDQFDDKNNVQFTLKQSLNGPEEDQIVVSFERGKMLTWPEGVDAPAKVTVAFTRADVPTEQVGPFPNGIGIFIKSVLDRTKKLMAALEPEKAEKL